MHSSCSVLGLDGNSVNFSKKSLKTLCKLRVFVYIHGQLWPSVWLQLLMILFRLRFPAQDLKGLWGLINQSCSWASFRCITSQVLPGHIPDHLITVDFTMFMLDAVELIHKILFAKQTSQPSVGSSLEVVKSKYYWGHCPGCWGVLCSGKGMLNVCAFWCM